MVWAGAASQVGRELAPPSSLDLPRSPTGGARRRARQGRVPRPTAPLHRGRRRGPRGGRAHAGTPAAPSNLLAAILALQVSTVDLVSAPPPLATPSLRPRGGAVGRRLPSRARAAARRARARRAPARRALPPRAGRAAAAAARRRGLGGIHGGSATARAAPPAIGLRVPRVPRGAGGRPQEEADVRALPRVRARVPGAAAAGRRGRGWLGVCGVWWGRTAPGRLVRRPRTA